MRTATIERNVNPVWNRKFVIPVNDIFGKMKISVSDEDDEGSSNSFLGAIEMPLLSIPTGKSPPPEWFALKDVKGVGYAGGDIQIQASFEYSKLAGCLALSRPREVCLSMRHRRDNKKHGICSLIFKSSHLPL